ncbi:hypothetical protein [uncultured Nostoc sp.]|uniref:hypothetical protein n=1 Tax=uncultured Nostoc sp. TaxID=340711 RepID=UPI0035C9A0C5
MANNRFGEKIILLNKEKICPFANISSNEFLRKTVAMNVISLWKCQEAVSRNTGAILHSNRHSLAAKLPDISLLVKHMTEDSLFCERLDWTRLRSNLQQSAFSDLFADDIARLATGLELGRYICAARRNWDNYKLKDRFAAGDEEDKKRKDIEEPLDNSYALYGIYD